MLDLFKEIAVNVNAKRASASVLDAAVATLAHRLTSKKLNRKASQYVKWLPSLSLNPGSSSSRSPRAARESEVAHLQSGDVLVVDEYMLEDSESVGRPTISSKWRDADVPDHIVDHVAAV